MLRAQSRRRVGHRVERAVFDRDQLGRSARQFAGLGDNERDRITHMPDPPARQRIAWWHDQWVDGGDLRNARERAQTLGAKISLGKDAEHA